ncbi:methyltransferase [soil metagenome]
MSEHYFSSDPKSAYETAEVAVSAWGTQMQLTSARGVFSHGRLDLGTSVLLRATRPPVSGRTFLDLGCGYGVLGCALATTRADATVWAVDVNERALELTRRNAERLGLASRVHVARPDEVPSSVRFDGIWSNPPIRIGKVALHALLLAWLPRLADGGEAMLVVSKNLGADSLQRWLDAQGYDCDRVGSAKGFRVLRVLGAAR